MRTLIFNSPTSPFARKVRVVLHEKGLAYDEDVRPGLRPVEELRPLNPNLSLPVLVDGAATLFESNVIIEYLLERYPTPAASPEAPPLAPSMTRPGRRWDDLKTLATIETFADTLVNVRHGRNEGRTADVSPYMARQEARMNACLDWLEAQAHAEGFWPGALSAMDIGLVCPLAYAETRGVFAWRGRPRLEAIYERTLARASFAETGEAPAGRPAGEAAQVGGQVGGPLPA